MLIFWMALTAYRKFILLLEKLFILKYILLPSTLHMVYESYLAEQMILGYGTCMGYTFLATIRGF